MPPTCNFKLFGYRPLAYVAFALPGQDCTDILGRLSDLKYQVSKHKYAINKGLQRQKQADILCQSVTNCELLLILWLKVRHRDKRSATNLCQTGALCFRVRSIR
ncbi:hypothetical protein VAA_02531 [Vibrio anguillarum 775]|nr:hypothetical protein VAA_02531 [Vibrio anguillarum 775]